MGNCNGNCASCGGCAKELLLSQPELYISAFPDNEHALGAYRKFGFVDDGREINGETVLRYDF